MLNRIFGFLGWAGSLLVFAAVAGLARRAGPGGGAPDAGPRRPRVHPPLRRPGTGARSAGRSSGGRPATGALAGTSILLVAAIVVAPELPARPPEPALGPDRGGTVLGVRPDPAGARHPRRAGADQGSSRGSPTFPGTGTGSTSTPTRDEPRHRRLHRRRPAADAGPPSTRCRPTAPSCSSTRAGSNAWSRTRSRT